jgi:hypothetical protein
LVRLHDAILIATAFLMALDLIATKRPTGSIVVSWEGAIMPAYRFNLTGTPGWVLLEVVERTASEVATRLLMQGYVSGTLKETEKARASNTADFVVLASQVVTINLVGE